MLLQEKLSPLRLYTLHFLMDGESTARELMQRLQDQEMVTMTGPGFYQFMQRLEKSGLVTSRYQKHHVTFQERRVRETVYRITVEGRAVYRRMVGFLRYFVRHVAREA